MRRGNSKMISTKNQDRIPFFQRRRHAKIDTNIQTIFMFNLKHPIAFDSVSEILSENAHLNLKYPYKTKTKIHTWITLDGLPHYSRLSEECRSPSDRP